MTAVPTSLSEVDEEIRRITSEIERIQKETDRSVSPERKPAVVPKFSNLPNFNELNLPKGFERAPVTFPYDPTKAQRLAALEAELRESLITKNRQECMALVNRIHRHQATEDNAGRGRRPRPPPPGPPDLLSGRVLSYLIPSIKF